jgi:hypothetical protein
MPPKLLKYASSILLSINHPLPNVQLALSKPCKGKLFIIDATLTANTNWKGSKFTGFNAWA